MLKAAVRDRIVKDVKPHGVLAELHVPLSDYKLAGWNKEVAHALKVQNLLAPVQQSACPLVRGVEEVRDQTTRSRRLDRFTHTLSEPSPEMILTRRLVPCNEDTPTVSDDGGARTAGDSNRSGDGVSCGERDRRSPYGTLVAVSRARAWKSDDLLR